MPRGIFLQLPNDVTWTRKDYGFKLAICYASNLNFLHFMAIMQLKNWYSAITHRGYAHGTYM